MRWPAKSREFYYLVPNIGLILMHRRQSMNAILERKRDAAFSAINCLLAIENPPFAMDAFYLEEYKSESLENYRRARKIAITGHV